ncbi:hypothetical protein [Amnibacterium endophyticum]|uniref:AbiEi antitoxin C-terminal domain-containing protein n=1 Tax=Amnibacterium endophyticum TaxID=2109337 RepID=A0ABW4LIA4_9MICO
MRTAALVEPGLFSCAEASAMRLDGDSFDLGLSPVAVDAVVGPEVRAGSLLPAALHPAVVVDTWTAAWVHGASPALPNPLTLAVDLARGRALRSMRPAPREARFGPGEVVRLGGVRVTSPLKTAFDLLLRDGAAAEATARDLLRLTGLDADETASRIAAMPKHNGKHRVAARARALLLGPAPSGADQAAETRYTS